MTPRAKRFVRHHGPLGHYNVSQLAALHEQQLGRYLRSGCIHTTRVRPYGTRSRGLLIAHTSCTDRGELSTVISYEKRAAAR